MKKYIFTTIIIILVIFLGSCSNKVTDTNSVDRQDPVDVTIDQSQTNDTVNTTDINSVTSNQPLVPAKTLSSVKKSATYTQKINKNSNYTIVIDAGHQKHQNLAKEPIAPGSKQTKAKVSAGTQGKYTGIPEYQVNLQVSLKLKDILKKQGYHVIMIREKNDVNISNSERAKIANKNHADVFIRIHCNGSVNSSANGILTISPTKKNPYCSKIYQQCRNLSEIILNSLCSITGAKNDGVTQTDTMSGINWSKVPVTIVEMGYMTNKKEDYKLASSSYQTQLAKGLANGITKYLSKMS